MEITPITPLHISSMTYLHLYEMSPYDVYEPLMVTFYFNCPFTFNYFVMKACIVQRYFKKEHKHFIILNIVMFFTLYTF